MCGANPGTGMMLDDYGGTPSVCGVQRGRLENRNTPAVRGGREQWPLNGADVRNIPAYTRQT
jgi:hypothetical protein